MKGQTALDIGMCMHRRLEEVLNNAGAAIALRCKSCTAILAHFGNCDGCGKVRKLMHFVSTRRYCSVDCHREQQRKIRAEVRALAYEMREKKPPMPPRAA